MIAQGATGAENKEPLTMVVMDPLSKEMACACVKGYAQRDYAKLGKHLEAALGRPVNVVFGESLTATLVKKSEGKADIIIGKESVVRHEAKANKIVAKPVASLTGKDGKTTMNGLVVVGAKDAALLASDLKDYRVLFGGVHCDEKHEAALKLFKELGIEVSKTPETCPSCSDGATKVVAGSKKGEKIATVISSYAKPLLEGCGTIEKGDLRVIGETEDVPFIVASVNDKLPAELQTLITSTLMGIGESKELLTALETKQGFVPFGTKKK